MVYKSEVVRCPECGGTRLIRDYEAGEIVCENCGYVVSTIMLNEEPEWRAFDEEQRERRVRVGAPLTYSIHDKGLSTIIDWRDRDIYGKRLKPKTRARVYRLRKWHARSKVYGATERNLAYALSELLRIVNKLNLPKNVLETASVIYRRVIKSKLIRGRSIQGVAAAAIYMACRECNVIRTLDEVAKAANISKKEAGRNFRFLIRKLGEKPKLIGPEHWVARFVNHLSLSGDVETIAVKILSVASQLRLTSGRGPAGMAAAATYIACTLTGEHRTQGEIARGANVTEVTIRNRYKELTQKLLLIVKL